MSKVLITGCAGFIGFHATLRFLEEKHEVIGIDNINDYYDVDLKVGRLKILKKNKKFKFLKIDINNPLKISDILRKNKFKYVIHLAAQAGVRYSFENPKEYIDTNIVGFFNLINLIKDTKCKNFVYASSSSVYGQNKKMPFSESDRVDSPISLYAASKKTNETLASSYSFLYNINVTGLRFFTAYGPFGRPDMALFKFTKGIINKKKIDIYNRGKMYRDFTYIDDIVDGINALINKAPNTKQLGKIKSDSLSPVAPFRILNIGNTNKVYLLNFINALEKELKKKAIRNYMPMQKGDVKMTLSDTTLLKKLTGYKPKTNYKTGIKKFLKWYLNYYKK